MAKVIEVIYVETTQGSGVELDPSRIVRQWWTTDGTLLFERDDWREQNALIRGICPHCGEETTE